LNTIVRKGRELDSERLRILPMGSRVRVQETCDRRVRIDMPVAGWCSLRSSNGDTILSPLQQNTDSESKMTPSSGDQQKYYENYKDQLVKKQKANEDAAKLSHQLLEIQQQIKKAEEEVTEQAELQDQVQSLTAQKEALLAESAQTAKNALANLGIDPEHLEDAEAKLESDKVRLQKEIASAQNFITACRTEVAELKNRLASNGPDEQSQIDANASDLRPGDVVALDPRLGVAIVRYFGPVEGQDGKFVGCEFSTTIGDTNGTYMDKEYFKVSDNKGMFLPVNDVKKRVLPSELLDKLNYQLQRLEQLKSSQE